jgi:hypothetical protein
VVEKSEIQIVKRVRKRLVRGKDDALIDSFVLLVIRFMDILEIQDKFLKVDHASEMHQKVYLM